MHLGRNVAIALALLSGALTGHSLFDALSPPAMSKTFSAPKQWTFAASLKGKSYHAKGCPALSGLSPKDLVYFNSHGEAKRQKKEPCHYCVKASTASDPSTPQTTPSTNVAHGNH